VTVHCKLRWLFSSCLSRSVKNHVWHLCNTKGETIVRYVLIFTLLDRWRESKWFSTEANILRFYSAVQFLRMQVWFISFVPRYLNPATRLGGLSTVFVLFIFVDNKRILYTCRPPSLLEIRAYCVFQLMFLPHIHSKGIL